MTQERHQMRREATVHNIPRQNASVTAFVTTCSRHRDGCSTCRVSRPGAVDQVPSIPTLPNSGSLRRCALTQSSNKDSLADKASFGDALRAVYSEDRA